MRTDILNAAMSAPETTEVVPGVAIRKVSLQSLAMLSRIGSPLANLGDFADPAGISPADLAEFVFIHAAPEETVRKLVYQPKRELFSEAADVFAGAIPVKMIDAVLSAIVADVAAVRASEASVIPDDKATQSKNAPSPAELPR